MSSLLEAQGGTLGIVNQETGYSFCSATEYLRLTIWAQRPPAVGRERLGACSKDARSLSFVYPSSKPLTKDAGRH